MRSTRSRRFSAERYAPAAVLAAVLLLGGGAILLGKGAAPPPRVVPGSGSSMGGGGLPEGHPPIGLPDDARQALDRLAEAAEQKPDDMMAWRELGAAQYRAGQVDPSYLQRARETYDHILEKEPDDLDALRGLGNVAFDQNDPKKAIDYYRRYLEKKPDDLNVQTDLGTMYLASRDPEAAILAYRNVLKTDPKFFQAQFNLAIAHRAAGHDEEALSALAEARDLAPDEATRKRVTEMLAQLSGGGKEAAMAGSSAGGAAEPAAATGDGLRAGVESVFRSHPIMGSRVDRFEWSDDRSVRVLLRDFPMDGMPAEIRQRFLERLRTGVREKKQQSGQSGPLEVQLVDSASGRVMETLAE